MIGIESFNIFNFRISEKSNLKRIETPTLIRPLNINPIRPGCIIKSNLTNKN